MLDHFCGYVMGGIAWWLLPIHFALGWVAHWVFGKRLVSDYYADTSTNALKGGGE